MAKRFLRQLSGYIATITLVLGTTTIAADNRLSAATTAVDQQSAPASVVNDKPYGSFALRTNLLYWVASPNLYKNYWPNINVGADYRLSDRWSLGLTLGLQPFPSSEHAVTKWRHWLASPEVRYWFGQTFKPRSSFIGFNIIASHYNASHVKFPFGLYKDVRNQRLEGDLIALGAFYGYTWRLNNWLRMEAIAGLALGYTSYDIYECGYCGTPLGDDKKDFLMPQLALNLVLGKSAEPMKPVEPAKPISIPAEPVKPQMQLSTVADYQGRGGELKKYYPVVADMSEYRPYTSSMILRKEPHMIYVHFPLDKTILLEDFDGNKPKLESIVTATREIMADTVSHVRHIQIVGLASIEGSIKHNQDLSDSRARALKEYVQERVTVPDSLFELYGGGEAWTEFRDQVNDLLLATESGSAAEAKAPTADQLREVLNIIDNTADANRREQLLKRHATWRYMRDNILADQRNSGYVRIYYDYIPDQKAAAINRGNDLLRQGKTDEALTTLQTVSSDPRSWNTLAVAYYQKGDYQKAADLWQRAADSGDADARNNLNQLRQWQQRVKEREDVLRQLSGQPTN